MSRKWVITAVCLLSCQVLHLSIVNASGTVKVRIKAYNYQDSVTFQNPLIQHRYSCALIYTYYKVILKQPNTNNFVSNYVPRGGAKQMFILRFRKWTGTLSCSVATECWKRRTRNKYARRRRNKYTRRRRNKYIQVGRNEFTRMRQVNHKLRREIRIGVAADEKRFALLYDRCPYGPAVFILDFRVTCDRHYFGADCSRHCRAQDGPHGHYNCTAAGHKRCRLNWRRVAANCTEPDPCRPNRCRNGAVCVETPGASFACRCPRDFRGRLCEVPRGPCEERVPNVNASAACRCPRPPCETGSAADVVFGALSLAAAAAVVVLVIVGLLCWKRATKRAICRPPQPLQVEWRLDSHECVSSCGTITTWAL